MGGCLKSILVGIIVEQIGSRLFGNRGRAARRRRDEDTALQDPPAHP